MPFCPFIQSDCVRERCVLWRSSKDERYSRCGLVEITRAATDANIKNAIKNRNAKEEKAEEMPF